MLPSPIETEVISLLQKLPIAQQYAVLEFVRALVMPHGTPGQHLLSFAGMIDADDLEQITEAIKQACEQVNHDEW